MKLNQHPFLLLGVILITASLASILVGSVSIPIRSTWQVLGSLLNTNQLANETHAAILLDLRLPRTLLMLLVGAALAGSGCAYQGLFRNPLADPYLIGAASGAGLGAVIAITIHWPGNLLGYLGVPLAAFIGSALTVGLVMRLASVGRDTPITTLILAGVAVSSFATAITSMLLINASGELRRALVWLVGGSTMSGWFPVAAASPYILIGLAALLTTGHQLNVLQFGEEQAQQLGVPVKRVRILVVLAATLATAAAVAFSGIIGFVGLIIPHILRRIWGTDHRILLPLSMLGGAAFLLSADITARSLLAPQEIPVGILTALTGAPFFLFLLQKSRYPKE
jgi:iron complex transport system permease protein